MRKLCDEICGLLAYTHILISDNEVWLSDINKMNCWWRFNILKCLLNWLTYVFTLVRNIQLNSLIWIWFTIHLLFVYRFTVRFIDVSAFKSSSTHISSIWGRRWAQICIRWFPDFIFSRFIKWTAWYDTKNPKKTS